jgi:hypothetical protein
VLAHPSGVAVSTEQTLIAHWDARHWRFVPSPNINDGSILQSVSAVSGNDVWAVGASYVGFGEISSSRVLVEHWDGRVWQIVPGPTAKGGGPQPGNGEAVAAITPDDVWVAWDHNVFRWDGMRWIAALALWRLKRPETSGRVEASWPTGTGGSGPRCRSPRSSREAAPSTRSPSIPPRTCGEVAASDSPWGTSIPSRSDDAPGDDDRRNLQWRWGEFFDPSDFLIRDSGVWAEAHAPWSAVAIPFRRVQIRRHSAPVVPVGT